MLSCSFSRNRLPQCVFSPNALDSKEAFKNLQGPTSSECVFPQYFEAHKSAALLVVQCFQVHRWSTWIICFFYVQVHRWSTLIQVPSHLERQKTPNSQAVHMILTRISDFLAKFHLQPPWYKCHYKPYTSQSSLYFSHGTEVRRTFGT